MGYFGILSGFLNMKQIFGLNASRFIKTIQLQVINFLLVKKGVVRCCKDCTVLVSVRFGGGKSKIRKQALTEC